jgi:hypothetical protein
MSPNTYRKNIKKLLPLVLFSLVISAGSGANARVHVWQTVELNFEAHTSYANPYTEVATQTLIRKSSSGYA